MEKQDTTLNEKPSATVIACAAEGRRRSHVLAAAIAECKRRHARLILYDIDAASTWTAAMPDDEARASTSVRPRTMSSGSSSYASSSAAG